MLSQQKLEHFKEAVHLLAEKGYTIENPDMFVYNLETCFFVEVKKEKDVLREPQMRFMYLTKYILGIDSKLIYLSHSANKELQELIEIEFGIPKELEQTVNNC